MQRKTLATALGLSLGFACAASHAASIGTSAYMTITTGKAVSTSQGITGFTGSYFGVDANNDNIISNSEKIALSQGSVGLLTNILTAPGASHSGTPLPSDTNAIDAPWYFFGNTGSDYLTAPISGSTTAGLNFSGWTMTWNGYSVINVSSGAWQPLNCSALGCAGHTFTNGNAQFIWDGIEGDPYSLNYSATIPAGDPSGLGSVKYYLHLEGVMNPVLPIPSAVWLLSSGLLGLLGVGMRKRHSR